MLYSSPRLVVHRMEELIVELRLVENVSCQKQNWSFMHFLCSGMDGFGLQEIWGQLEKSTPPQPLPPPKVREVLAFYIIWTACRRFLSLSLMLKASTSPTFRGERGGEGCSSQAVPKFRRRLKPTIPLHRKCIKDQLCFWHHTFSTNRSSTISSSILCTSRRGAVYSWLLFVFHPHLSFPLSLRAPKLTLATSRRKSCSWEILVKDFTHVIWKRESILWSSWSRVVRPTGDVVTSTAKDELHRGGESRLLISTHYLSLWPFKSYQTSFIPLNKGRKEEYLWKYFWPFPSHQHKDIVPFPQVQLFSAWSKFLSHSAFIETSEKLIEI